MKPFVYIIKSLITDQYYIGSRYGKDADPEKFFCGVDGYYTSSPNVRRMIESHGIESFLILRIRVFETPSSAYEYETRLLRRVRARTNPKFINGHENNNHRFGSPEFKDMMLKIYGTENIMSSDVGKFRRRRTLLERYGVENPAHVSDYVEKSENTSMMKYGTRHPSQCESVKEKQKLTLLLNHGVEYALCSPIIKQKMTENFKLKYGVENPTQLGEVREKTRNTNLERYGVENPGQSPEIRERMKETNRKRLGYDNPSSSPEIKAKKKLKQEERRNRPIVLEIQRYLDEDKSLKSRCGMSFSFWQNRNEDYLEELLDEIKRLRTS